MAPAFTSQDLTRIVRAIRNRHKDKVNGGVQYLRYSPLSRGWVRATGELDRQVRHFVLSQLPQN